MILPPTQIPHPLPSYPSRSNTAAITVFQVSLSEDIHHLWLAVVDSKSQTSSSVTMETTGSKTAPTVDHSAPPLPVKSAPPVVVPPNPLPRNKEVIMYLEKIDH